MVGPPSRLLRMYQQLRRWGSLGLALMFWPTQCSLAWTVRTAPAARARLLMSWYPLEDGCGNCPHNRSALSASRTIAHSLTMSAQLPSLSFLEPKRAREKGRYFRRTCRDLFIFSFQKSGPVRTGGGPRGIGGESQASSSSRLASSRAEFSASCRSCRSQVQALRVKQKKPLPGLLEGLPPRTDGLPHSHKRVCDVYHKCA